MIQLVLFLLLAALLFGSLYFLARRSPQGEGGGQALAEARQALNTLQGGLLPPDLVRRIFSKTDLEYVTSAAPEQIRYQFCRERKRIALAWVSQVYRQVVSLRHFHLGAARFYAHLSLRTEWKLARDFALLSLACRSLQALIYLSGPYAAPRMIGFTMEMAARICEVSEKSLAFLTPAYANGTSRSAGPAAF
jgi:hypothetical protein